MFADNFLEGILSEIRNPEYANLSDAQIAERLNAKRVTIKHRYLPIKWFKIELALRFVDGNLSQPKWNIVETEAKNGNPVAATLLSLYNDSRVDAIDLEHPGVEAVLNALRAGAVPGISVDDVDAVVGHSTEQKSWLEHTFEIPSISADDIQTIREL